MRYQPATSPLQVGGDWYDVVDLDDGRIALIVGDCVGHGLSAATVMGQLRSACRALLLERPSPSAALTALDQFAARLPGARCTTAFCAVLSPDTGELMYSSAGHPPPIMVQADGTTQLLDGAGATPLGIFVDRGRPEAPRDAAAAGHAACSTPTDWWSAAANRWTPGSPARPIWYRRIATPLWMTWPARSCPGSRPTGVIRTTSPCCFTGSPRRWRWSSRPTQGSSPKRGPHCVIGSAAPGWTPTRRRRC